MHYDVWHDRLSVLQLIAALLCLTVWGILGQHQEWNHSKLRWARWLVLIAGVLMLGVWSYFTFVVFARLE